MNLPDAVEQQRLKILFEDAIKNASAANQRAVQASLEIAKEKTQYFEKIALANAGTIALVVSFVGSHSGKLQPPWLLRSALVALFLAMVSAMFRNWTYPFYQYAVHARQNFAAKREKEQCRLAYARAVPSVALESGERVDIVELEAGVERADNVLAGVIAKAQKHETCAFTTTKHVEWISLVLTVTGMVLLIALAWENF
jgi:hypothetical protein